MSELSEVIYTSNISESNPACFFTALTTQETFTLQGSTTASDIVGSMNPMRLLYAICFKVHDFIELVSPFELSF